MSEIVTCYSGSRYAERPVAFRYDGEQLEVAAVERTWREPAGLYFITQTPDGRRFRLMYDEGVGRWHINQLTKSVALVPVRSAGESV